MPDVNIDFGDGAVQTPNNGGGTGEGVADITGNNPKPNDVDITGKDNNNKGDDNGNPNPNPNPDEGKDGKPDGTQEEQANPSTGG